MTARSMLFLAVGALCACQGRKADSTPRLDTLAPPRPVDSTSAIQQPPPAPPKTKGGTATKTPPSKPIPPVVRESKGGSVTVAEVLDSPDLVGRVVTVKGRCLGYAEAVPMGPPPSSRSDWKLQSQGRTVYVSGAFPAGCTAMTPSVGDVTIAALVLQDTLKGFGGKSTPRRYLRIADRR